MPGAARAFWIVGPSVGEIRSEPLPAVGPGEVRVRTRYSAVSRGTERLVFEGRVPASQHEVMRAPFQVGDFGSPVKYGYLSVGTVEDGPDPLVGRTVFVLHPHQSAYVVPLEAVTVVPDDVPAERAVLTGTVETAVNALWDAAPLVGDRVAVVGAGMVGCCVARLLARVPGADVTLVDVDASRAEVARALGVGFATPEQVREVAGTCDLTVHTSASSAGLQLCVDLLGVEGTVLELSWYGDHEVRLGLGASFHSSRLTLRASQVGAVALPRRARRSPAQRRELALDLLRDNAFDALLTGRSEFARLPEVMPALVDGSLPAICHTITYAEEPPCSR